MPARSNSQCAALPKLSHRVTDLPNIHMGKQLPVAPKSPSQQWRKALHLPRESRDPRSGWRQFAPMARNVSAAHATKSEQAWRLGLSRGTLYTRLRICGASEPSVSSRVYLRQLLLAWLLTHPIPRTFQKKPYSV